MTEQTYTFHSDSGHGWLEVSRQEIQDLGISRQISDFSYQCGDQVFLEEDCDLAVFIEAKGGKDNINIHEISVNGNSFIRNYRNYRP